ncbi:sugar transferase [candidate division FCPU426 bacterium]|nr:sugar transferase [candidate division FCPU426 bacterium]
MSSQPTKTINTLLLLILDGATLVAAFLLAYALRVRLPFFIQIQPLGEYLTPALVLIVLSMVIFIQQGLYRDVRDLSMLEEYAKIIKALAYAFLLALGLTFFFKFYEKSRVLVLLYWLLAVVLITVARFVYYQTMKQLRARGWNQISVAVVGSEKKIKAVQDLLQKHAQLGYHVAATLVLPKAGPKQLRRLIDQEILARFQRREIEAVIVSDTVKNYQHLLEVNEIFDEYGIPHRHVSEAFDLVGFKASTVEGLEGLINSLAEGQVGGGKKVLKRFFDEVFAILIILLTSPLWVAIMLAIKLDSPGPVFFRQERIGYQGRKFLLYKFRSMFVETPKYAPTPRQQRDPRITRVGKFLRRMSLDELPQVLNVIKGDMSMVGPRPEMAFMLEKYKPIYRYRLLVLPGLTGLWQVSGRSEKPLEENIKYDLYYIKNQSLLLDLVIFLRTIPTVLFGRGAF